MWTDRQDAKLILRLMLEDRLPQIWVASWENRDLRQLLWHRHRMVQARMLTTRSGNWWCGDLHPTRFAALSAAPAKLRLFANNAGSFGLVLIAWFGSERVMQVLIPCSCTPVTAVTSARPTRSKNDSQPVSGAVPWI